MSYMSNFFEKSDVSRKEAESIISDTLQKCDDGELYLENSKSESILLDDNKIKNSSYNSDLGFGFRAISDEVVAYSHSNEISKNSLKQSSENLKSTLKSVKGTYNNEIPKSNKKYYENINPIEQKYLNEKIKILNDVNDYLRSKGDKVKQVTANFLGEQKSVEIIRSGGETLSDVRPLVRFNVSVMVEKDGRKETGVYGVGGRQSYDSYLKDKKRVLPCAAHLSGEYRIKDMYVGVPVVIGKKGVEKILEISLNSRETKMFKDSIASVKSLMRACSKIDKRLVSRKNNSKK